MEGQMSIFDLTGEEDNGTVSTNERTNERYDTHIACLNRVEHSKMSLSS